MTRLADHHAGVAADELRREQNEADGRPLCKRCGGTGNEILLKYRRCSECGGSGVAQRGDGS